MNTVYQISKCNNRICAIMKAKTLQYNDQHQQKCNYDPNSFKDIGIVPIQ